MATRKEVAARLFGPSPMLELVEMIKDQINDLRADHGRAAFTTQQILDDLYARLGSHEYIDFES